MTTREDLLSRKRMLEFDLELINEQLEGMEEVPELSETGIKVLDQLKKKNEAQKRINEQLNNKSDE